MVLSVDRFRRPVVIWWWSFIVGEHRRVTMVHMRSMVPMIDWQWLLILRLYRTVAVVRILVVKVGEAVAWRGRFDCLDVEGVVCWSRCWMHGAVG